jgi:hypothetical protein
MKEEFFWDIKEIISLFVGVYEAIAIYFMGAPLSEMFVGGLGAICLILLVEYRAHDIFISNGGVYSNE